MSTVDRQAHDPFHQFNDSLDQQIATADVALPEAPANGQATAPASPVADRAGATPVLSSNS